MAQTTQRPTEQPPGGKRLSVAERRAACAEQARLERQRRQRQRLLLMGLGALVLAVAAFFAVRAYQANQIGAAVANEGQEHTSDGTALTFKHYPPSSGTHYNTSQRAGVYKEEVPEGKWIHSLEHGYVVVLLKCADGCPDLFEKFTDLYNNGLPKSKEFGNVKLVVTSYSKPFSNPADEAPITLLAWNRELMLKEFDREQILRFYSRYVDQGPEKVP